jgi:hypothetical protein
MLTIKAFIVIYFGLVCLKQPHFVSVSMYLFLFSGSQEGRYQPGMVGYMGLVNL